MTSFEFGQKWNKRKNVLAQIILESNPDVITLQDVKKDQFHGKGKIQKKLLSLTKSVFGTKSKSLDMFKDMASLLSPYPHIYWVKTSDCGNYVT